MTNDPLVYTFAVLGMFCLVSGLFMVYDVCVERRQRIVMKNIMDTSNRAKQLADKIHDRNVKIQETNKRLQEANRRIAAASAAQLQNVCARQLCSRAVQGFL